MDASFSRAFEICPDSGKRKYSRKDAGSILNMKGDRQRAGKVRPRRAYFCDFCGAWHLTSNPKKW